MSEQTQFNLLVPCYRSNDVSDKPVKCRINFQVTHETFNFTLVDFTTYQKLDISYSDWKYARVFEWFIAFLNEDNVIRQIFFFFNDQNNFKRFLFSLVEAGILVPNEKSTSDFYFIQEHSFIPETDFSASKKAVTAQMRAVMQYQLSIITQTKKQPFNPNYINYCLPYTIYLTNFRIKDWIKNRKSHLPPYEQLSRYKTEQILNTFYKNVKIDDEDFNKRLQNLKDPKYSKLMQAIDSDTTYYKSVRKVPEKVANVCDYIFKLHCVGTKCIYSKSQFMIIQKICLLMMNKGNIKDDPCDLPSFMEDVKISDDPNILENDMTFIKYLLAFFEYFIEPFDNKDPKVTEADIVESLSKSALNIITSVLPHIAPYFILHDIKKFTPFKTVFPTLFTSQLVDNIWPLWIWLMKIANRKKGMECIYAAIVYLWIPEFIEKNVTKEAEVCKTLPKLDENFQNLIEAAFYFYAMYKPSE